MIVLIPAYEPGRRLVELVRDLRSADPGLGVLVVDDGSGAGYADVFRRAGVAGADVLTHDRNRGKGAALKTGFAHLEGAGEAVVCADCDGQHAVADILRVAGAVGQRTGAAPADTGRGGLEIVLGGRAFSGHVPLRSRFGNSVTRGLFRAVTGTAIRDTQTGLRGYPAGLLPWLLGIPGERFEYEFNVLLAAPGAGIALHEVEIATIYLEGNTSSHFRPVADSVRIYAQLLRFAASSFGAFLLDAALLFGFSALSAPLVVAVVGARVISSVVNFTVNRTLVFRGSTAPVRVAATKYFALAAALLAVNYALIQALTWLGIGIVMAKVVTEPAIWLGSYVVQHRYIFTGRTPDTPARDRGRGAVASLH